MELLIECWPLVVVLLAAFVIGWAAETAETFISRALALSILAWLQTLPEFAVEAAVAWQQQRDLMIANLTGSLRLLVGLGWPMIFFTHFFFQGLKKKRFIREIHLGKEDSLSVMFLFISILYFVVIYLKGNLNLWDSGVLTAIYAIYLVFLMKLPAHEVEDPNELPWIGKKILVLPKGGQIVAIIGLFAIGGAALLLSVEPFIHTLEKWAIAWGISTFVFIQWVAPFLSEFPEKVSAFNWARQEGKETMAIMNMVNSNINQWTMLAAMIPLVFNISLGHYEPVFFDAFHSDELELTIMQSLMGGILLLDLKFSVGEAALLFVLWLVQFIWADSRHFITTLYIVWSGGLIVYWGYQAVVHKRLPKAIQVLWSIRKSGLKSL